MKNYNREIFFVDYINSQPTQTDKAREIQITKANVDYFQLSIPIFIDFNPLKNKSINFQVGIGINPIISNSSRRIGNNAEYSIRLPGGEYQRLTNPINRKIDEDIEVQYEKDKLQYGGFIGIGYKIDNDKIY
jgi:hypothetical protein